MTGSDATEVRAAIGYLLQHIDEVKSIVIVWEEKDKGLSFACSNTTITNAVGMFEVAKTLMLRSEIGRQKPG